MYRTLFTLSYCRARQAPHQRQRRELPFACLPSHSHSSLRANDQTIYTQVGLYKSILSFHYFYFQPVIIVLIFFTQHYIKYKYKTTKDKFWFIGINLVFTLQTAVRRELLERGQYGNEPMYDVGRCPCGVHLECLLRHQLILVFADLYIMYSKYSIQKKKKQSLERGTKCYWTHLIVSLFRQYK